MDKKELEEELKPIGENGRCVACKFYYFNPGKEDSHYYEGEEVAQGHCTYFPNEKVGTTSMSHRCKHFKIK